ncbi:hypothetical protein D3C71_1619740 [compost metagenome]
MIGSREYRNTAVIAGIGPRPWPNVEYTGSSKPNRAIDGMVSSTVALACRGPASDGKRVIRIPSGTPTRIARVTAIPTRVMCCQVKCRTSGQSRWEKALKNSMAFPPVQLTESSGCWRRKSAATADGLSWLTSTRALSWRMVSSSNRSASGLSCAASCGWVSR